MQAVGRPKRGSADGVAWASYGADPGFPSVLLVSLRERRNLGRLGPPGSLWGVGWRAGLLGRCR